MRKWFVRQQGKVFGPFDDAKLSVLLDTRQIEQNAECGESWNGPWMPLTAVLARMQSSHQEGGPQVPVAPGLVPPPPSLVVRSNPSAVSVDSVPIWLESPAPAADGDARFVHEVAADDMPSIKSGHYARSKHARSRCASHASNLLAVGLLLVVAAVAAAAVLLVVGSPAARDSIFGRQKPAKPGGKRPTSSTRKADTASSEPAGRTVSSGSIAQASQPYGSDSPQRGARPRDAMLERPAGTMQSTGMPRPAFLGPEPPAGESDKDEKQRALASQQQKETFAEFAAPAFDPDRIDVIEVRRLSESLRAQPLGKEDSEVVDEALSRTRPREWKDKKGKKVRGEVVLIMPERVHFRNEHGEGPFRRDDLADSSEMHLKRLAESARDIFELNRRLMSTPDASDGK